MNEKTMETITAEERAAHIIDMCHRMTVHHTLWFREADTKGGSSSFGGTISFP